MNEQKTMYRFMFGLNTVDDIKKYVRMLETIPFSGLVQGKGFQCAAEDILFIFSQCMLKKLVLMIPLDQKKEAKEIVEYLEREGLLSGREYPDKRKKVAA